MYMIEIQLKAKHFYLIADILLSEIARYSAVKNYLAGAESIGLVVNVSQPVIDDIRTTCQSLNDDDLATVSVGVETFVNVFRILAQKPEGSYNNINTEMMDLLTTQIATGVGNNNAEWISLNEQVTSIRTENLQVVTNQIANGKGRLYN
jgi:hypothetical protein